MSGSAARPRSTGLVVAGPASALASHVVACQCFALDGLVTTAGDLGAGCLFTLMHAMLRVLVAFMHVVRSTALLVQMQIETACSIVHASLYLLILMALLSSRLIGSPWHTAALPDLGLKALCGVRNSALLVRIRRFAIATAFVLGSFALLPFISVMALGALSHGSICRFVNSASSHAYHG